MSKSLVAAIFPGQGVQEHLPAMSRELLEADPLSESTFQEASRYLGKDILKLCLAGDTEQLSQSQNLQPAIAVSSVAALESLKRIGLRPDIVAGHSLGEYPALFAAESITFESMCRLVSARAEYMEEANNDEPGRMAAILSLPLENIKRIARETGVDIAGHNVLQETKEQIVLSGSHPAVEKALHMVESLKQTYAIKAARRRINAIDLDIPYAAHSRGMRQARRRMASFIRHIPIYDPTLHVVANRTGLYFESASQIRHDLPHQLTRTVLWDETVRFMESEGVTSVYEVGPGSVLSGINKHIVGQQTELIPFDPSLRIYSFNQRNIA